MNCYDTNEIHDTVFKDLHSVKTTATVTLQELDYKYTYCTDVRGNCTGLDILSSMLYSLVEKYDYEIPLEKDGDIYLLEADDPDELKTNVVAFEITNVEHIKI